MDIGFAHFLYRYYDGGLSYIGLEGIMATNPVSEADLQPERALPAIFASRLRALADRQGISLEEALAQAIRLDEVVLDAKSENAEVLLVKGGEKYAINFR